MLTTALEATWRNATPMPQMETWTSPKNVNEKKHLSYLVTL